MVIGFILGGVYIFSDSYFAVLVRAFWEEGNIDDAIEAVKDMERRGVVGTASVYYELACCLCNNGRWREAMVVVCFLSINFVPTLNA